jgi:serine/threonine-protein kinase
MGTPGFMSPEQARGDWDAVDERTDVWSVGATMFALLTGREVHECGTQQEALVAAMTRPAPPIREVEPAVPERVAMIIDRALAFRPEDRWGTAGEMQRQVQHAMALLQPSPQHDEAPPTLRPVSTNPDAPTLPRGLDEPKSSSGWRVGLVAAAAIVAVAALGTHHRTEIDAVKRQAASRLELVTRAPAAPVLGDLAAQVRDLAATVHDIEVVVESVEVVAHEDVESEDAENVENDEARESVENDEARESDEDVHAADEAPAPAGTVINLDLPDP